MNRCKILLAPKQQALLLRSLPCIHGYKVPYKQNIKLLCVLLGGPHVFPIGMNPTMAFTKVLFFLGEKRDLCVYRFSLMKRIPKFFGGEFWHCGNQNNPMRNVQRFSFWRKFYKSRNILRKESHISPYLGRILKTNYVLLYCLASSSSR